MWLVSTRRHRAVIGRLTDLSGYDYGVTKVNQHPRIPSRGEYSMPKIDIWPQLQQRNGFPGVRISFPMVDDPLLDNCYLASLLGGDRGSDPFASQCR